MALVVPNTAEVAIIEYVLNQEAPQNLTVRLYSNDLIPTETSITADFTEVVGGGYAAEALTPANWTVTPGNPSEAVYDASGVGNPLEVVFTFNAAVGNVYGYYVTRTDNITMWAERFTNGPFNVTVPGSEIRITLRFTANSEF